jgi:hypothetical protein
MDKSLMYLVEAQSYINKIKDVSLCDFFFEETDEMKEINTENEKATKGALNALKKSFRVLIDKIKEIIKSIGDFFTGNKNIISQKSQNVNKTA